MSKFSPICISDTDESDTEETKAVVLLISDEEDTEINDLPQAEFDNDSDSDSLANLLNNSVIIKSEPVCSSEKPTATPKTPITLNINRLKWLSCQIKLSSGCDPTEHGHAGSSVGKQSVVKKEDCDLDKADDLYKDNSEKVYKYKQNAPSPTMEKDTPSPAKGKNQISSPKLLKSQAKKLSASSPLKYDKGTSNTSRTPRKKTILERYLNSPQKVGAFGSPEKPLKQTTLTTDSFTPKKLMTRHEDKLEDNSHHTPPLHATQANGYGTALQCSKPVLSFTNSQVGYLENIREEGCQHTYRYIDSLLGLVAVSRKPSPELCFSLLSETLLRSHSYSLSAKAFCALKRIQAIHPIVPEQMTRNVTFDFVEEVVERLEMTGCTCKHHVQEDPMQGSICLKASNALKTLTFLVDLMEMEIKRKQFSPRKTIAFRLVSLERVPGNVFKVLSWIKTCIKLCCNTCLADSSMFLTLFQRLIQLSLSVSENPDKCADELARELLSTYSQLPNLESRTLLLQTLQSHLLRSKFLRLYVDVFCEKAETSHCDSSFSGIQWIIRTNFDCLPLRRDDVTNLEARMCSGFHRSDEECEEHAMIITYSLQSYLFCHHKKLQSTPKNLSLDYDGIQKAQEPQNRKHLSVSDVDELVNMGDKVQIFAARLFSLCPSLTGRTTQLIGILSDMKMWDPW